jgi:hypothetical protein
MPTNDQENEPIHADFFDDGNEKLVQDQIKPPAPVDCGSQIIMLCSRRNLNYIAIYRSQREKEKLFENSQDSHPQKVTLKKPHSYFSKDSDLQLIEENLHLEKSNRRRIYNQIAYETTNDQENRPVHTDFFDDGNEKLIQDQIKTPAPADSGSQVIMPSYSSNHRKPYRAIKILRNQEIQKEKFDHQKVITNAHNTSMYNQSNTMTNAYTEIEQVWA